MNEEHFKLKKKFSIFFSVGAGAERIVVVLKHVYKKYKETFYGFGPNFQYIYYIYIDKI